MKVIDISGQRFGRLVAIKATGKRTPDRHHIWEFKCDCGNTFTCAANRVKRGNTTSCGCFRRQRIQETKRTERHTNRAMYEVWQGMKQRCHNPNHGSYRYYGGRGITVCGRWQISFKDFLADMGTRPRPHLTLERMNNDGNYEPGNVRWATRAEQNQNTRITSHE